MHFPITFVDNPKNKNEKLIDRNLKEKLVEWKQDFILLLIKYCNNYLKNGLKFPKGVEEQTKLYKASADSYEKFFDECLEENIDDAIRWTDLKDSFSNWYRENIGEKIPDAKEIKKYFENKFNKQQGSCKNLKKEVVKGWKGWSIKECSNENSDDE